MCTNDDPPVVNIIILKYARLNINGNHFLIQDGGQIPCRWRWVLGFILIYIHTVYKTTSVPMLVLLSQNAQSDDKVLLTRCSNHRKQRLLDDSSWKSLLMADRNTCKSKYVCVCVRACVLACACVFIYVCVRVRACMRVGMCAFVRLFVRGRASVRECAYVRVRT